MKVAVSIPDPIFHEAERASRRMRLQRSQLYARAIEAFVRQHSGQEITARLNDVVASLPPGELGWENPGLEVLRRERW